VFIGVHLCPIKIFLFAAKPLCGCTRGAGEEAELRNSSDEDLGRRG
jgi:hypothetical protein